MTAESPRETAMDPRSLCTSCLEPAAGPVCPLCGWRRGSPAASPLYLPPGMVLHSGADTYLMGRVLGHGGFGITYLGYDPNLRKKVAIKEYFPSGLAVREGRVPAVRAVSGQAKLDYESGLERFLDEGRTVRKLRHHVNIVRVENLFPANGTAYLVMEYLDGVTLLDYLKRKGGRIDWETLMRVMMPVLDALREVHANSFLHRDISPDNIYLLRSGVVKVIDFGAARQAGQPVSAIVKGGYTPLEQYQEHGSHGPWTDIYAAAATMYRALTGETPPPATSRAQRDTLRRPRELGVAIGHLHEDALMQALRVDGRHRFQTVAAFQNALRVKSTAAPAPVARAAAPDPAPKTPKWALPLAVAAMIAILLGWLESLDYIRF